MKERIKIMIINKNVKVENGVVTLKTPSCSKAKSIVIDESCLEPMQSVDVTFDGSNINIKPCEFDGSAYIITEKWGVLYGEMTLCSLMFISINTVLISVDNGYICYEDENGDIYCIGNDGTRGKVTPEQAQSINWFKAADMRDALPLFLKTRTQQYPEVIRHYVDNFVFAYSFKSEREKYSYKLCNVDDSLVAPYGLVYTKFVELDLDGSTDDYIELDDEDEDEDEDEVEEQDEVDDDFLDNYEEYDEEDLENEFDDIDDISDDDEE